MPLDQSRTELIGAQSTDYGVSCDWADGHQSQFAAIALRHHCCAFGTSETGVRSIRIAEIPTDIRAQTVEARPDGIAVFWSDGHRSEYDADWLRAHCTSDSERDLRRHKPILWDGTLGDEIPVADFTLVENDPKARLKMLLDVCDYGVCKIINAPTDASEKLRMIHLVGPQRITNHGTFTLSGKKAVDNVGDTTMPLDPHTDECYRLSAIGITVFQVLRPAATGGDTTLVDGFEVARRLKEQSPEDFDILTKVPVTCHRIEGGRNAGREKRHFESRLPVIQLDGEGEVVGFRLNERQIAPLDLPQDLVVPTYRALRRILEIAYDPALTLEFKLKAGEGLLFDNQRALHGRTGFQAEDPPVRSVLTSSVDLDDFYSNIQMLRAETGAPDQPSKFGQGMAGHETNMDQTKAIASLRTEITAKLSEKEQKHLIALNALREALPEDTVVMGDACQLVYSGAFAFPVSGPRQWHYAAGYCPLGYALPNAIGAKMADPERPVAVFAGDGGFMFTLQELATAAELQLSLPIVVWDNQGLQEIRDDMRKSNISGVGVDGINPDFLALARAMGCKAVEPTSVDELKASARSALSVGRPTLVLINEQAKWLRAMG